MVSPHRHNFLQKVIQGLMRWYSDCFLMIIIFSYLLSKFHRLSCLKLPDKTVHESPFILVNNAAFSTLQLFEFTFLQNEKLILSPF